MYVSRSETVSPSPPAPPLLSSHSLTTTSRVVVPPPPPPPPLSTAMEIVAAPGFRSRRGNSTEEPSRGTASVTLKKGTTVRKLATSDDEEGEPGEPETTDSDTPSTSFSAVTRCRPERPIAERSLERPEERA